MNNQRMIIAVVGVASLLLAACAGGQAASPSPSPYPTGPLVSECFPTFKANVWLDANGDGKFDPDERPLDGVRVEIVDKNDPKKVYFLGNTDFDGRAQIQGITEDCELTRYQARVTAPAGYKPTGSGTLDMTGFKWDKQTLDFPMTLDVTATPASDATPSSTGASAPTLSEFKPCDALSRSQAEAILGPFIAEPQPDAAWGERQGHFVGCFYQGAALNASLYFPDRPDVSARDVYDQNLEYNTDEYGADRIEFLEGLGEAAYLVDLGADSGRVTLNVLRGDLSLEISVYGESGLRDAAIQIAEIALIRIP